MNIDVANLSNDVSNLQLNEPERKCESSSVDYGNVERDRNARKSSTSSVSSFHEKRKLLNRKNSEVKIEEIFKQLFSPDAKIIDNTDLDFVINLPDCEETEAPDIRKNDKFTVRRQTSLARKEVPSKKIITQTHSTTKKPIERKRQEEKGGSAKWIKPKPLHRVEAIAFDSVQSTIETSTVKTSPFARRNAIPLRRALSVAQKT